MAERPRDDFDDDDFRMPADLLGSADDEISTGDDDFEITFVDEAVEDASVDLAKNDEVDEVDEERDPSEMSAAELRRERELRLRREQEYLKQTEDYERRIFESEKRSAQAQADSFRLALDGLDVRIRTATEGLKYARQEGDYSAETDLEEQIRQLREMRSNIEQNMRQLPNPDDMERAFKDHIEKRRAEMQASSAGSDVKPLNEKAGKWIEANRWFNDPSMTAEKKSVMAVNQALVDEGYDPKSDAFFRELTRRIAKRHPSLQVKDITGQQAGGVPERQQRKGPPVASARPTAAPQKPNAKTRVTLDASDRSMLKALGIDPADKKAVAYYAKQKHERMLRETRR